MCPAGGGDRGRIPLLRNHCLARQLDTSGYLSLTEADREAMLEAIGVASLDELFEQIPQGVPLRRQLDVPEALPEAALVRRMEDLAARNADTTRELASSGWASTTTTSPRSSTRSSPRGELLTAYTPYQPEMSQGVLQAIFEYQTAICELTAMDVSNASGYDGTTVAADACFIARHHTGRSKVVLAETLHPRWRARSSRPRTGLRHGGRGGPHSDGSSIRRGSPRSRTTRRRCSFSSRTSSAASRTRPSSPPPPPEAGALPVAHVDLASLGLLEAPGNYGCAMAIGEGQSIGNYQSYGGPHYGFLAARGEFIRRMPGRIVGETTDLEGRRGFVLTLQTREQHIRREKATSNMTTNQTLLALAGLITLCWLGPEGLRELGETCTALAQYAKERVGLPVAFDRPTFKEVAFRTPIRPARSSRGPASTASTPGTRSVGTTRRWTTSSWWRSRRSGRRRTSTAWPRCSRR